LDAKAALKSVKLVAGLDSKKLNLFFNQSIEELNKEIISLCKLYYQLSILVKS
jgi:hypothetical protein